jgi:hypothetical protein
VVLILEQKRPSKLKSQKQSQLMQCLNHQVIALPEPSAEVPDDVAPAAMSKWSRRTYHPQSLSTHVFDAWHVHHLLGPEAVNTIHDRETA